MNKIPSFLVVSRYNEDFSWIYEYVDENYLVGNKGDPIYGNSHIHNLPNEGGNQKDIFQFIYENYNNLPALMAFVQANPFDHIKKEVFDQLIYNKKFTSLEYYGENPSNGFERRNDGQFLEINNSWYIPAHNETYGLTCRYSSFDDFMNKYFSDYTHIDWIRFCPGSQYIIKRKQALNYSRKFWGLLMCELIGLRPTEGHIIERALWHIFNGTFRLRKEYDCL